MDAPDLLTLTAPDGAQIVVRRYRAAPGKADVPRLLLSHGNGFAIGGYRKFWELLAGDFELCLFDQRNHGMNPLHRIEDHTIEAMAGDHLLVQREAAAAWGARFTAGLFHSVSSIAAIKAAQMHGARWDALILYDPPLIMPPGNPLRDANKKLDQALADFARKRPQHYDDLGELAAMFRQRIGRNWVAGAEDDMAAATTRAAPAGGYDLACPGEYEAKIYFENAAYDSCAAMDALGQPTMLICADPELPRQLPPASSGPQAAAMYGLPHVSVAGTTHMLQVEKPDEVAAHTRAFLGQHCGAGLPQA